MKMISLEEISTIVTGGTPSTEKKEYWDGGNIPWLQSGCCQNCYVESASAYITKLGYDNSSTRMMPKDTVLIALTGATAGKVGYLTFEACANQSVTGITPKKGYSPKFIYYYLQYLRPKILFDCIGGAQPHISQGYVKKIQIPGIDLESQEKIVEQIDNIKNEISNCEHQLSLFDELVKSRFIEMFGDVLKNDKGFATCLFGDYVNQMNIGPFGSDLKNDCFVPKERGYCMVYEQKHAIDKDMSVEARYVTKEKYEKMKRFDIGPGDVIVSCRGTIGECFILPSDAPHGIIHPSLMMIKPKEEVNHRFLVFLLEHILAEQNEQGSGVKMAIKATELAKITTIKPSRDMQDEFIAFIEQIDKSKFNVQSNIGKLNELLDKLMNDSFGGSFNA